ncbi:MAG: SLC13 family permease [Eubacteriales bacterium]
MKQKQYIFWLKLLLGPSLFVMFQCIVINGLESNGRFILGLYLWIISWWVMQPIPWGITSLLPLVILPIRNIMNIGDVATLYGQRILFFMVGVLLFGYAVQKHGLGKRIALHFLSLRWVGSSTYRVIFVFMLTISFISAFIDDAAAIALGIPIGLSIITYVTEVVEKKSCKKVNITKFQTFMILGVLYASEAGGIMTIAGIPHIATAISVMEKTTNHTISFIQWSSIGIIMGLASIIVYFVTLCLFFKPEFKHIEGAQEFFTIEKQKMGSLNRGEKNILIVFVMMLVLWLIPVFYKIHFLDIWIVPIIGLIFLYILPANADTGIRTLAVEDLQKGLPWNIIFLILCGSVMASLTIEFGVIDWIRTLLPTTFNGWNLAFITGFATAALSNFISGVATVNLMGNIFFPVALEVGFDPTILARILPAAGMAIMLPWAGAATGTAFSTGKIKIGDMIRCGFVATVLHLLVIILIICLLVPYYNA